MDPYEDFRVPVEKRVEDILSQMTIEEKAGMMLHPFLYSEEIVGIFIKNKIKGDNIRFASGSIEL